MSYTFLGFLDDDDEVGFSGLKRAPQTADCRIMLAHIDMVNFQSYFLIKKLNKGANIKEPTPLPAMVMPVATPLFLSKYSAIIIKEEI